MCKRKSGPQYKAGTLPGRRKLHKHSKYKFHHFISNHSVITANLKKSSNKVIITVPYKVGTGNDRNIMKLHICKCYFPWQQRMIGDNMKYKYPTENIPKN